MAPTLGVSPQAMRMKPASDVTTCLGASLSLRTPPSLAELEALVDTEALSDCMDYASDDSSRTIRPPERPAPHIRRPTPRRATASLLLPRRKTSTPPAVDLREKRLESADRIRCVLLEDWPDADRFLTPIHPQFHEIGIVALEFVQLMAGLDQGRREGECLTRALQRLGGARHTLESFRQFRQRQFVAAHTGRLARAVEVAIEDAVPEKTARDVRAMVEERLTFMLERHKREQPPLQALCDEVESTLLRIVSNARHGCVVWPQPIPIALEPWFLRLKRETAFPALEQFCCDVERRLRLGRKAPR